MPLVTHNGVAYFDDRMFLVHICRCTAVLKRDATETTIYHDNVPAEAKWCVVTYRNTVKYPAVQVDHFETREQAQAYVERIEPTVPVVSLGGVAPEGPIPYSMFVAWKAAAGLKDYDYKTAFSGEGTNNREVLLTPNRPQ